MKTLFLFLLPFAGLMAGAFVTTHQTPDAALVLAGAFAAGLTAWTFRQYERRFLPAILSRPLRLPIHDTGQNPPAPPERMAA